jgi:isopentenyl diphosphate isomerase/L-lactate dehydrogenase-like FMN-dependent dehydrogenase
MTFCSSVTVTKLTNWKAVGDKTYIMFDSGVRGAADVFKALALGAKFVFVGKSMIQHER